MPRGEMPQYYCPDVSFHCVFVVAAAASVSASATPLSATPVLYGAGASDESLEDREARVFSMIRSKAAAKRRRTAE